MTAPMFAMMDDLSFDDLSVGDRDSRVEEIPVSRQRRKVEGSPLELALVASTIGNQDLIVVEQDDDLWLELSHEEAGAFEVVEVVPPGLGQPKLKSKKLDLKLWRRRTNDNGGYRGR
jgi:hypothetical protein